MQPFGRKVVLTEVLASIPELVESINLQATG